MVKALAALALLSTGAAAEPVDIGALVASWPSGFVATGTKTEPTYIYHVRVTRDGERFELAGGAPANLEPARETVEIADGAVHRTFCSLGCADPRPPIGFLATATIIAAVRAGRLAGSFDAVPFGDRTVICVPAEALGVARPIVDPCVDRATGAVLAQRHRLSGEFDGPSLDPWSVTIDIH